jgi:hypothetical protein
MQVQLVLGDIEKVMLRGVTKAIDCMQAQSLILVNESDRSIRQRLANACVEANRFLVIWFLSNLATHLEN